jgi:hypothetical protein
VNAVRGATNRAKVLREQATKKLKSEQVKMTTLEETTPKASSQTQQHGRSGLTVMVLGLLRRKDLVPPKSESERASISSVSCRFRPINDLESLEGTTTTSSSANSDADRSIKGLSIRQVLERHDRQDENHHHQS